MVTRLELGCYTALFIIFSLFYNSSSLRPSSECLKLSVTATSSRMNRPLWSERSELGYLQLVAVGSPFYTSLIDSLAF